METIRQAMDSSEITTDGKNGFFRGVLWANEFIDVNDELPTLESNASTLSEVVIAKCENYAEYVSAYFNLKTKKWISYPGGRIIEVTEWRPIERA